MAKCRACGSEIEGTPRFCPSCGSALAALPTEPKPAGAPAPPASSPVKRVALILFPIALVGGLIIFWLALNPSAHPVIGGQPEVSEPVSYARDTVRAVAVTAREEGGELVFPLELVTRHRLVQFEYTGGKTPRSVLAYIEPSGRLVTAIALSEHCGSTEFTLAGNDIWCARCPSHWDMTTMEPYACCPKYYPDPIPSRVVGNEVRVSTAAVTGWAGRL